MTSTQLERAKRHDEICKAYRSLANHEVLRPYGIMRVLAVRFNLSVPGVAKIVQAAGLYTPHRNGRNSKEAQSAAARSEGAADAH